MPSLKIKGLSIVESDLKASFFFSDIPLNARSQKHANFASAAKC